jgi:hypothetical protein
MTQTRLVAVSANKDAEKPMKPPTAMRLHLYKQGPTWMFDDATHNIKAEPFVEGSSEMIDLILRDFGFPTHGRGGVTVEFGLEKMHPDMVEIRKVQDMEMNWARYEYSGHEGNFCPVTTVYLGSHPDRFYVRPI